LILLGFSPLHIGLQSEYSRQKWRLSIYFRENIWQTVSNTATVTIHH